MLHRNGGAVLILHFLIGEDDSILVSAAQITAIRETGNDLVVYLAGAQIRVRMNDYNRSAVTLWQVYVEEHK